MIFSGLEQIGASIGQVIKAPFNIAGGIAKTALGVVALPFQAAGSLVGGLFGGLSSPASIHGAQSGILPFL
jgi:hypothetical protein